MEELAVEELAVEELAVVAPGRICLFGEHQDFLGLAVIASAIDLHIRIQGLSRRDKLLRFDMPDIGEEDVIDLQQPIAYQKPRDYLRSVVNVLKRAGFELPHGFDIRITGQIPINAGTSSSSALVIAWVKFVLAACGAPEANDVVAIAKYGHEAEVLEFHEPGGMMDHYTSSMGGTLYIDCAPPITPQRLNVQLDGFVLADSLERKQTLQVLRRSKEDVLEGLRLISEWQPNFNLKAAPIEEALDLARRLPEQNAKKVIANIRNRDLCQKALAMLSRGDFDQFDQVELGEMLTEHQHHLSEGLGVSTPKLDSMVEAAIKAGALGAKLNGSGGGGCMFAYAPGRELAVAKALEDLGAKAYVVGIDPGARVVSLR